MFPESRPSRNAILGAGGVMVALGLVLLLGIGRTAYTFDVFGYTLGFLLLGFGVAVIVAAIVRSRRS